MVPIGGERYCIRKKLDDSSFRVVFESIKLSKDGPLLVAIKFVSDLT